MCDKQKNLDKVQAVIDFEDICTKVGRCRLGEAMYHHGITSLLRVMPADYTLAMEYLIRRFDILEENGKAK